MVCCLGICPFRPPVTPVNVPTPVKTIGLGKSAATTHQMEIKPHESITAVFVVTGSNKNIESAMASFDDISKNHDQLLQDKQAHYTAIINRG